MIEIEFLSHEPPEGWARDVSHGPSGSPIHFSGWVGLIQALVALTDQTHAKTSSDL